MCTASSIGIRGNAIETPALEKRVCHLFRVKASNPNINCTINLVWCTAPIEWMVRSSISTDDLNLLTSRGTYRKCVGNLLCVYSGYWATCYVVLHQYASPVSLIEYSVFHLCARNPLQQSFVLVSWLVCHPHFSLFLIQRLAERPGNGPVGELAAGEPECGAANSRAMATRCGLNPWRPMCWELLRLVPSAVTPPDENPYANRPPPTILSC